MDDAARAESQRQRVISYQRFFGSDYGREVMLDLMNKFHVLTPLPRDEMDSEFERGRSEGKRDAVLYMLEQAHMDMARFDKILKGDFS